MVTAGFGTGDYGHKTLFLHAQVGVERVYGFGRVADDDEDFIAN